MGYSKCPQWAIGELDSDDNGFFVIPSSVILGARECEKLVTAFSFFSISRGVDSSVTFSINMIVDWCGKVPNRNPTGINTKLSNAVNKLNDDGFILLDGNPSGSSFVKAKLNKKKITELCQEKRERFATIYADEVLKIIKYDGLNSKNRKLSTDTLLYVFTYLRMMIYKRNGDPNATQYGDPEERKKNSPEAYACYINNMANELGLTSRAISDTITILKEMELIYFEQLPRVKNDDGTWRTRKTIFCNWYKREKMYIVDEGKRYYEEEVKNKKIKLNSKSKDD